jgi:protein gp37
MAENSKIEWTHHTFNPWRGCTKVSDGCKNCYAETLSGRNHKTLGTWGPKGERVIAAESYWQQPTRWNRDAERAGERRRVFCASLADVFEGPDTMPTASIGPVGAATRRLFGVIQNTPSLDWLLLTKRPENIMPMLRSIPLATGNTGGSSLADCMPFPNVWLGTSCENQEAADERIPHLLRCPAKVRFLSCEPLLGPVNLTGNPNGVVWPWAEAILQGHGINWVICGGESGPGARPMHPDWVRSLRNQCQAAGVPFFFKQWGEWANEYPQGVNLAHRQQVYQHGKTFYSVSKKAAGRLLDGRLHNEFPTCR